MHWVLCITCYSIEAPAEPACTNKADAAKRNALCNKYAVKILVAGSSGQKKIEQRRVDGCGMFCDTCLTRHMTYGKKIADAAVGKWLRGKQEEGRGRLTKVCQKNGL